MKNLSAPAPGPGDRQKLLFQNKGKDSIHIQYLKFQSSKHPRHWDCLMENSPTLTRSAMCELPIVGPGEVFIKWSTMTEERADHYTVQFDPTGVPYPYIFGGDQWTMALRHAALKATAENGNSD